MEQVSVGAETVEPAEDRIGGAQRGVTGTLSEQRVGD
jgi:hypothetical protein